MPIQSADVQFRASQIMDDVPEGGGGPTAIAIRDGVSNDVMPDISEVARTGGRTYIRKLFLATVTDDTDRFSDANIILSDPPADPRVSVTLYSTKDVFDRRDAAKSRAEAYYGSGSEWSGYLLENHLRDQRSIQLFQLPGSEPPNVGRTLRLVYHEGLADQREQYVRTSKVTETTRTFVNPNTSSTYQAQIVACELMDALRTDFPGSPPSHLFTRLRTGNETVVRDTTEANAITYYGASRLAEAAAFRDLSARVESVFSQIVPSAQTEIPLIDYSAAGQSLSLIDSGNGTVSYTTVQPFNASTIVSVGNAIWPGTLSIAHSSGTLTDNGGQLYAGATAIGTVNYARGEVQFAGSAPTYNGSKTVTFRPAAAPLQLADSAAQQVTQETRSYNWTLSIVPAPAPGTLQISYCTNGRWYDLRDNGAGVLKGADSSFGIGTISYTTGTATITCGALPDVGSAVLYNWGDSVSYINRSNLEPPVPVVNLQLSHPGVAPGIFTLRWNDGTDHTAHDDGHGRITGAATGTIRYQAGGVQFTPSVLPAGGQQYTADYAWGEATQRTFNPPLLEFDGSAQFDLGAVDIVPGSVEFELPVGVRMDASPPGLAYITGNLGYKNSTVIVSDDGAGGLHYRGSPIGTVDYATGIATILIGHIQLTYTQAVYGIRYRVIFETVSTGFGLVKQIPHTESYYVWGGNQAAQGPAEFTGGLVRASFRSAQDANTATETVSTSALTMDLTPGFAEPIVPGSIGFTLGGKRYFDRSGALYTDLDVSTGAATQAGAINYQAGEATLTHWSPGVATTSALQSLLTSLQRKPVDQVAFRIPIAPVRVGSVQVLATKLDGGQVNATANLGGSFVHADATGTADYATGVVLIRFGQWVTALGNESAPWYSADAVVNGKVFRPQLVFADTIRYNAVGYTYLPLDADIIGMDPVRLPQDGRVSIYRRGGYVVFGHTGTMGPVTVSAGQNLQCGRARLARVSIMGANGIAISSGYSANLDAGTIAITDVTGWSQPVTIRHRIEEMKYLSDVQINGQLAFTTPLTREFPAGSVVSSALMCGDLHARVSLLFDQFNWNGSWKDAISGEPATATYNEAFPIVVTNRGALTERWIIVFTNTTTFNVIGEHVGQIITGASTAQDCAPMNPAASAPYWTLKALGLGMGWAAGNVIRFNTVGTPYPFWVLMTVQPGQETVIDDGFGLLGRGGVDRPPTLP